MSRTEQSGVPDDACAQERLREANVRYEERFDRVFLIRAADITVELLADDRTVLATGTTDADGRLRDLGPQKLPAGTYRLRFDTGGHFAARGVETFYPEVVLTFAVTDGRRHVHVPLLLSPFAYSTYRGS